MTINVQLVAGEPEYGTIEQFVIENHPENSQAGPCVECEPKDQQPVAKVGYPPFHPHCVCTVEWKER